MDAHTLKPVVTLAKLARTPFAGESPEYRKAREACYLRSIDPQNRTRLRRSQGQFIRG